jgi:hypothetical protein
MSSCHGTWTGSASGSISATPPERQPSKRHAKATPWLTRR